MAWGGWATCRTAGTAGMCAAAQAALCKATARHRQLVLQLGGSADSLRLTGKEGCVLLAGLRQAPVSPKERQELERLWVLFLSALELFLEDLCQAHHFCQLFSVLGGSTAPMHTRLEGWELPSHKRDRRGGDPTQPPSIPRLEEIEQVRAMLVEMESRANIPLWMVEATAGGARWHCSTHGSGWVGVGLMLGTVAGCSDLGTGEQASGFLALGLLRVCLPHVLLVG
uniref:Regulator of G-protein signaling 9-binding protein n=1 Tax=Falco tinnunculus TaxID=100819 RepID=A0A8C4TUE7_FALTI